MRPQCRLPQCRTCDYRSEFWSSGPCVRDAEAVRRPNLRARDLAAATSGFLVSPVTQIVTISNLRQNPTSLISKAKNNTREINSLQVNQEKTVWHFRCDDEYG